MIQSIRTPQRLSPKPPSKSLPTPPIRFASVETNPPECAPFLKGEVVTRRSASYLKTRYFVSVVLNPAESHQYKVKPTQEFEVNRITYDHCEYRQAVQMALVPNTNWFTKLFNGPYSLVLDENEIAERSRQKK